jgi:hypothetical protein
MMSAEYFSSDFEPFGVFEFSDATPITELIYDTIRDMLGPAFQQPVQDAETFADAICLGISQLQLEAAGAQSDPVQISYLLDAVEKDYQIIPLALATLEERRAALKAAMTAAHGALTSVIFDGLETILGDGFVYWRPMDFDTEVTLEAVTPTFVPVRTPIRLVSLTGPIFPGARTIAYTMLVGDGDKLMPGDKLTVDPGRLGLAELVTVTAVGSGYITATFTRPHDNGVHATTAPHPRWVSNKCHSMVVVTDSVRTNPTQLEQIHLFMRKCLPASNTWCICSEITSGLVGPFCVDSGLVGQTPIADNSIDVEI